jgi:hypothetical protein
VELRSYLEEDDDADIRLAVEENDETMYVVSLSLRFSLPNQHLPFASAKSGILALTSRASQTERIDLIIVALENKVGRDALGHYGLDLPTSESGSATKEGAGGSESGSRTSDRAEVQVEVETEAENDGGLHL